MNPDDLLPMVQFNPPLWYASSRYIDLKPLIDQFRDDIFSFVYNNNTIVAIRFKNRDAAIMFKLGVP